MTHHLLIGRQVPDFLPLLGSSLAMPDRPLEGDPEYGLDRHLECPDRGLAVMINASDVCRVQFFGAGKDSSYREYAGALPGGVRFAHSRDAARTIMGPLVKSSDGAAAVHGIEHRPWELFTRDGLRSHLEYAEGRECILMVSVMLPPVEG